MSSDLHQTGLVLEAAPLPPDFVGTPQQMFEAMLARTGILSPFGITTFVIGPNEPPYNQGPWLKNGTQWWVWSDDTGAYIPQDISASDIPPYWVQNAYPPKSSPPLWFEMNGSNTRVLNVHFYTGVPYTDFSVLSGQALTDAQNAWRPLFTSSGTTADRPTSPVPLESYFDTDINAEIWFERGQWRTRAGSQGDVKFVSWPTQAEAITRNPGWEVLGTGETSNTAWRGCVIGQATKDASGDAFSVPTNTPTVTAHAAQTVAGAETHTLTAQEIPVHSHKLFTDSNSDTGGQPGPDDYVAVSGGTETDEYNLQKEPASKVPSKGKTGDSGDDDGGQAHSVVQPTLYLFTIRKM